MTGKRVKQNRVAMAAASLVLAAGLGGSAVAKPLSLDLQNQQGQTNPAPATTGAFTPLSAAGLIVGKTAVNSDGSKIGHINEVVRSRADKTVYAVVSVKAPPKGTKDVTIPYSDIKIMPEEVMVRSDLTASDYATMPAFEPDNYTPIS